LETVVKPPTEVLEPDEGRVFELELEEGGLMFEFEEGVLAFELEEGETDPEKLLEPFEEPEPEDPCWLSLPPDPAPVEGFG
jgi:hypothetical protein